MPASWWCGPVLSLFGGPGIGAGTEVVVNFWS